MDSKGDFLEYMNNIDTCMHAITIEENQAKTLKESWKYFEEVKGRKKCYN